MSTVENITSAGARFSRGAFENVARQFPDLYRAAAVDGDPSALAQLQRIMLSGSADPRGLGTTAGIPIPSQQARIGTSAGAPVGGIADRGLIPAQSRAMSVPGSRDLAPLDDGIIDAEFINLGEQPRITGPSGGSGVQALEGMPIGRAGDDIASLFDDAPPPSRKGGMGRALAGATAAGLGGAWVANEMRPRDGASGDTTADLKAETKPPPSVASVSDAPAAPEKPNYREQAYAMMKELNARRAAAGAEVPGAKQTVAEINRLLAMASKEDNAAIQANSVPAPSGPTDYRRMAQQKMAELNQWQGQHGVNHPRSRQLRAEMQQLYALADQQANARTTALPRMR